MEITHQIIRTIDYYGMFKPGDTVLVCVSGGPDSVFLVHVLEKLKKKLGIKLYIAHMDHGIRGAQSRRDAEFVKKMAKKLGIKSISKKLNQKKTKSKFSLEERLREARYGFFKDAGKKVGTGIIATAHTLDDQAETVMMRIIKGATLKGMVGIHPVRRDKNIRFVRPLIEIEKKDIVEYLKKKKIRFKVDKTNLENKFLRNRIRNNVLPYLGKINPRIKRSLFNLAQSLREDFEFIDEEKRKRQSLIKGRKKYQHIMLRDILLQPKALQRELVREAIKATDTNVKKLTFRHWKSIDNLIRVKERGKAIDLPGNVRVRKDADRLSFIKK